jgi:hypothetical protein
MAEFQINFRESDGSPRLLEAGIADGTNPPIGRCGFMSERWESQSGGWAVPVLGIAGTILAVCGLFLAALHSLAQPTVYENPGLAAYTPPAATRLVPLPRVSDAPELAQLPDLPSSPLTALAQAEATDKPATDKPASEKPAKPAHQAVHKHARAIPRGYDQQRSGYAQQNYENRDWNSNRAWAGGFKTWF